MVEVLLQAVASEDESLRPFAVGIRRNTGGRREAAMVIPRITAERLKRAGQSFVVRSHDMANAYGAGGQQHLWQASVGAFRTKEAHVFEQRPYSRLGATLTHFAVQIVLQA